LRSSHSFPTRRSSDLADSCQCFFESSVDPWLALERDLQRLRLVHGKPRLKLIPEVCPVSRIIAEVGRRPKDQKDNTGLSFVLFRSEEHTSELQSPCNL